MDSAKTGTRDDVMKQKQVVFGLGGIGLSLALGSSGIAQQGDAAEEVPAAVAVPVEVEEGEGFIVVQGQEAIDEAEMLRQIMKELTQQGISDAQAREMLGLEPADVDAEPTIETTGEVTRESPDGEELYLPLGTTQSLTVEDGATLELPFVADGPGILTVAYSSSARGRVAVSVLDRRGRQMQSAAESRANAPVRHELVPLSEAGEYIVRVTVRRAGELKIGAEWIPFPQIESVRAQVIPEPDEDTELVLVPDRMMVGSINTAAPETQHLWCRFDAEEDGQLVVLASASQGDITMQSFMPGQFQNALEYRDDDLNGSVANEGMILDVEAGESYYVRVDMRSGQRCDVEVRTGFIPLLEEE